MKIKLYKYFNHFGYYGKFVAYYAQEQFDYVHKYLSFDKLNKEWMIRFYNKKTEYLFRRTYIDNTILEKIYNHCPEGYQHLKENFAKGIFKIHIEYSDKQELKTIVNRLINIDLIGNEQYENKIK